MGKFPAMTKSALFFGLVSALLLLQPFESRAPATVNAATVKGQSVNPPRRIVSLVPAVTEILFGIGAGDRVVGVTWNDTMPAAAGKAVVGGFFSPSMDRIMALNPDLVVVSSLHHGIVRQCDQAGIATLYLDLSTLSRSFDAMARLGRLVRRENAAQALRAKVKAQLDLVARKTAAIPPDRRLRVIRLMAGDRVMTPGDDSFQNEMIRAAGAIPPALGENGAAVPLNLEQWRRFNPQVVYGCEGDKQAAARLFGLAGWKDVDAVKNHRIYYFPCELTCRAGIHTGDFVAWLAARLYGDRFSRPEAMVNADRIISSRSVPIDLGYVESARVIDSRIYDFTHKTLLVSLTQPMAVVSTLEGMRRGITAVGNHFFPSPCWYIGHENGLDGLRSMVCRTLNRRLNTTALLFTGADMDHLAVGKESFRGMTVYALVTAGARANAMRAAKDTGGYYEPGTINILVMSNMKLTQRAMTRAIVAATEAKSAALEDLDIRSSFTPRINGATGTGTDNVIVVEGAGIPIDNAGGHSKMGELISRAVYKGVTQALFRQNSFAAGRNILQRLAERNISIARLLSGSDCPCSHQSRRLASTVENLMLEPAYASFMAAALAVSDDHERGTIQDLSSFELWARAMARQVAGGPVGPFEALIPPDGLPTVLYTALNALANGAKAAQERQ